MFEKGRLRLPSKVYRKRTAFGTTRTVTDNYGTNWFTIAAEVRELCEYKCVQCGAFQGRSGGEVHHRRPLSKGGTTTKANLELLCGDCHQSKHTHHTLRKK